MHVRYIQQNIQYPGSGTETGIFQENEVIIVAAEALATCVAKSSAMVLCMQEKTVLVVHKEGFQLPVPSQWWEMM